MRLTHASYAIASVLMSDPGREWYGNEIRRQSPVASGVLYPILDRMLRAGWLDGRWEQIDWNAAGRPPRRYYLITPAGRDALAAMLERASRDRRFSDSLAR